MVIRLQGLKTVMFGRVLCLVLIFFIHYNDKIQNLSTDIKIENKRANDVVTD